MQKATGKSSGWLATVLFASLPLLSLAHPAGGSTSVAPDAASLLTSRDAMCGATSAGGKKCGMNTCCSSAGYCGTTEPYCGGGCQAGYGQCKIIAPPSCGRSSGTTNGRNVGYFQARNAIQRTCDGMQFDQVPTAEYTHLNFAFAGFDSSTFAVAPIVAGDADLYRQFTALKSRGVETWIAIGGGGFSTATWSSMASSPSNRAAFISSLGSFMAEYGFQGVDLDWEFPSAADTQNLVALVREMRAAYGSQYGISVVFPTDYWSLASFDGIGMQDSVDWFGFMSYDLAGFGQETEVKGQTDMSIIADRVMPLWYDGLDPSKINFGLAYYGRGYTLSNPSCNTIGCGIAGKSEPAECTKTPGFMALREIEQKIASDGLSPTLLQDAMMKQIVFGDQWIGYDDSETFAMKKAWANEQCFGGTMVWAVEFGDIA